MKKSVFTVEEVKRKLERYCVYQDRCHKDVEGKLREFKLIPEAKEAILLHLLQEGFLNEERFAKSFARGKFRIKKWGKQRIIRELKFREISAYNIKTALKEIEEQEYIETIYSIAERKNQQLERLDNFERKKKLYSFLNYRGYEASLIQEVLQAILEK